MRRIEALTDRSWKYMAFSKVALVREILPSLIRLRTVSSDYETDVFYIVEKKKAGRNSLVLLLPMSEKRGKGERHTDSSYTTDSHTLQHIPPTT